ncbi:helix-turn-helix domain-containing protein [Pseudomonas aeruginosa]
MAASLENQQNASTSGISKSELFLEMALDRSILYHLASLKRINGFINSMSGLKSFATALARLRASAGLSQRELAEASGLSTPQIQRYETNKSAPRLGSIMKLATALNVPVADLEKVLASEDSEMELLLAEKVAAGARKNAQGRVVTSVEAAVIDAEAANDLQKLSSRYSYSGRHSAELDKPRPQDPAHRFIQNHEEFAALVKRVFHGVEAKDAYEAHGLAVVGGQALVFWYMMLIRPGSSHFSATTMNYLSTDDLDFVGNAGAVRHCEQALCVPFKRPSDAGDMQQATINLGMAKVGRQACGDPIIVDVIDHVPGITAAELRKGIDLISIDGVNFPIISPLLCLKARINNLYAPYKPDKVKELERIKVCVELIRQYFSDQLSRFGFTKSLSKDLEYLFDLCLEERGRNLAVEHGVDFLMAIDDWNSDDPKAKLFQTEQLPRAAARIKSERVRQKVHNERFGYKSPLSRHCAESV